MDNNKENNSCVIDTQNTENDKTIDPTIPPETLDESPSETSAKVIEKVIEEITEKVNEEIVVPLDPIVSSIESCQCGIVVDVPELKIPEPEVFLKYTNETIGENLSQETTSLPLDPLISYKTALLENVSALGEKEQKFLLCITSDLSHVILTQIYNYSTKIKSENDIASLVIYVSQLLTYEKNISHIPVIKHILLSLLNANIIQVSSNELALKNIENSLQLLEYSIPMYSSPSLCIPHLFCFFNKKQT